jgi:lysophospholipase L1-like esterase
MFGSRRTAASTIRLATVALAFGLLIGPAPAAQTGQQGQQPGQHWVGTWATAPVARPTPLPGNAAPVSINNRTLRQIVHVSIGGDRVRVVFSNVFGTAPLAVAAASVALAGGEATIRPKSGRALTFNGRTGATIPPGAVMVSDSVALSVPSFADLAIDLYLPEAATGSGSPLTVHNAARQTNYISTEGNHTGVWSLPQPVATPSWFFLSRVEVTAPEETGAIVLFGDSITDGFNSTIDANNRWGDVLARRFRNATGRAETGILNLGIDGNQVLKSGSGVSALARFDRDVLAQPGATHVVLLEGINDLGFAGMARQGPPTVADLQSGHLQLVARAHARGLRIIGATLLPYEGTAFQGYYSEEGDATREAFNQWIRTSGAYDGVIDFDAVVRDQSHPSRLLERYDSGDHLHPNDAGYAAMANAVDLALLRSGSAPRGRPAAFLPATASPTVTVARRVATR